MITSRSSDLTEWLVDRYSELIINQTTWAKQTQLAIDYRNQALKTRFFEPENLPRLLELWLKDKDQEEKIFWTSWVDFVHGLSKTWRDAFVLYGLFPSAVSEIVAILRMTPVQWSNGFETYLLPWIHRYGKFQIQSSA